MNIPCHPATTLLFHEIRPDIGRYARKLPAPPFSPAQELKVPTMETPTSSSSASTHLCSVSAKDALGLGDPQDLFS